MSADELLKRLAGRPFWTNEGEGSYHKAGVSQNDLIFLGDQIEWDSGKGNGPWQTFTNLPEITQRLMLCGRLPFSVRVAPKGTPHPLTEHEQQVLDLIRGNPGILGKQLATRSGIPEGTITKSVIPKLKAHYGVKNKRRSGYFVQR